MARYGPQRQRDAVMFVSDDVTVRSPRCPSGELPGDGEAGVGGQHGPALGFFTSKWVVLYLWDVVGIHTLVVRLAIIEYWL